MGGEASTVDRRGTECEVESVAGHDQVGNSSTERGFHSIPALPLPLVAHLFYLQGRSDAQEDGPRQAATVEATEVELKRGAIASFTSAAERRHIWAEKIWPSVEIPFGVFFVLFGSFTSPWPESPIRGTPINACNNFVSSDL